MLGLGRAGPSNYHNVGLPAALANLEQAAAAAWASAGLPAGPADRAFVGVAAIKSRLDAERVAAAAARLAKPGGFVVGSDALNALAGGLEGRPGIAVISGTGAVVIGRDAAGAERVCDGWGWLLGDRGSGFALGLAGLRAATLAVNGRAPATRLVAEALEFFGLADLHDLPGRLYGGELRPGEVAAFAPRMLRLAAEGEAAAVAIAREEAEQLAEGVAVVAAQLSFLEGPELALIGGCVAPGSFFRAAVLESVLRRVPAARVQERHRGPLHGAALNVLRLAGRTPAAPLLIPD